MTPSRRDFFLALAALAPSRLVGTGLAAPGAAAEEKPLVSAAYRFEDLPVRTSGPNRFRQIFSGATHQGFHVGVHESELALGERPHPPHHHAHEEVFLIRSGELEVTIAGGSTRLGPGSAACIASNIEHGIQNVGATRAEYFVVELGTD